MKDAILSKNANIISKNETKLLEKQERISTLEDQLIWLRRQIFGKKSEKYLPTTPTLLIPGLFDELLSE